jgi:hypothetical protein
VAIPFESQWASSPHNDSESETFRYWDGDDPPQIPASCAKCHSTPGYLAYLGADGSESGAVESPAPLGTTIECIACHNEVTLEHDSVVFPSGLELADLGSQAACLECHQGLASKFTVDEDIAEAVGEDLDTVSEDLGFINIHYDTAAATHYGTEVKGGYEYDGMQYDPRFDHVDGYQACVSCHDMHTLELKFDQCTACHEGVTSAEDLQAIRFAGSLNDFNGNGDIEESILAEIAGLQDLLYQNIQAYAAEVPGTPIIYDLQSSPYFFVDTNADGQAGEDEIADPNQYASWTGRLLKAAYNFQFSQMDAGAYAHGAKYVIQLLYDSIADLNDHVSNPVDMSLLHRQDPGHFAASGKPWRYWDQDGEVPSDCSRCHSAEGLPTFLTTGGDTNPQPVSSGLNCASCHDDLGTFSRLQSQEVEFPSGAVVTFEDTESNLCLNCHQGLQSSPGVAAILEASGAGDDEVGEDLAFPSPHYAAAGATLFGSDVKGAYEFADQSYNGRFLHIAGFQSCIDCHDTHQLTVQVDQCTTCHGISSEPELADIRIVNVDFDGDGDTSTGLAVEIANINNVILDAIYLYAAEEVGVPILFDAQSYPYWFIDTNADGMASPGEVNDDNSYNAWTPRLLRTAYNYTWALKDPGSYAHNGLYVLQVLYDTLQHIGGNVSAMTRPAVAQ